ncbi:MAG: hypothetical protein DHS20C17_24040 [Cyclobacteriaceae bacterium]|nr:MAG: hypothetical protein DHS20C17_24040 [Cyclobacteriaceae bacterium]
MQLVSKITLIALVINSSISVAGIGLKSAYNNPCQDYWELSYQHPYLREADSLRELEQFENALGFYQMAAKKFKREKNWKGLLKASDLISDILRTTSKYDTALSILNQSLMIINDHLNGDSIELATVYFIQGVNYDWQKQYDASLQAYNQALEIRKRLLGEIHIDVALSYSAIGEMYLFRQQFLNAKKYLTKATDIIEQLDCPSLLKAGNTYYYLASAYRGLADSDKAGVYGLKALSIHKNNTINDQTRCYNLLGNLYLDMQDHEQSNKYNFKAISLLLEQQPLSNTQKKDLANYYNSVGSNYTENEKYDSAYFHYLKALKIYKNLDGVDDAISLIYQNIGINYTHRNQFDSAYHYLSRSVKMRKLIFGEKNFHSSSSLGSMGELFEAKGELDSALNYYQQAIVAGSGADFNSLSVVENPKAEFYTNDGRLLEALWSKATVLERIYQRDQKIKQLTQSLETLMVAIDLLDQNQKLYQLDGSALLLARDYYGVFENALNVCFELFNLTGDNKYLETTFLLMEKSKARLLFDTFSDLERNKLLGIPDSLVAVENLIKSRLASNTRNLEIERKTTTDDQQIQNLEEKVFQSTVDLEDFYQSLDSIYPSYTTMVKNKLLDLNTIQAQLGAENRVLLDYFWGDSTLFSLVIEEDNLRLSRQPIGPVLELIKAYQQDLLEGPQFTNQATRFTEFSQNAYRLYQALFDEIKLKEVPLIIAADGPLRFIPFEGLVVEKPEPGQKDYHQLKYLVLFHPTSYVYSANFWAMQPRKNPRELRALGFSHANTTEFPGSNLWNELPGTAAEIGVLKSLVNGLYFSGPEATKQKFLEHAQEYQIIHLAIHGISDSISRLNNRLLFRNSDHPDQSEPLYAYELYNLQLTTRLAVLSACESGIGRNYQGEGVYSMSRAFSYAGCPTTVMSLWRIPDNTTPEILEQFYKQIAKGKDVDQALRKAKLDYLSDNQGTMAHPALWAAMVVHGASGPITSNSNLPIWAVSVLAVCGLVFWTIKKSNRFNKHQHS